MTNQPMMDTISCQELYKKWGGDQEDGKFVAELKEAADVTRPFEGSDGDRHLTGERLPATQERGRDALAVGLSVSRHLECSAQQVARQ